MFSWFSRSSVGSRGNADITTTDGSGTTIPLVVSNMTAVSVVAWQKPSPGVAGIAILPQDVPTGHRQQRRSARHHIRFSEHSDHRQATPHTVGYTANPSTSAPTQPQSSPMKRRPIGLATDKDLPTGTTSPRCSHRRQRSS